jgi:hypothetical protein
MHTGRTAESGHYQPGVISEYEPIRVPRVIQRLARRIFRKSWRIFLKRRKLIEARQQFQFERNCGRVRCC